MLSLAVSAVARLLKVTRVTAKPAPACNTERRPRIISDIPMMTPFHTTLAQDSRVVETSIGYQATTPIASATHVDGLHLIFAKARRCQNREAPSVLTLTAASAPRRRS